MTEQELRKLQLVQLMILKDVDSVCKANSLKYYMVGGTLLGAVRHKGSIPWDDDIDIAMYREDYNKIQECMEKEFSDKYKIQTPENDKRYTRQIIKVRLKGTKMLEENMIGIDADDEIYIDIFPLDRCVKPSGFSLWLRGKIIRVLFAYNTMRSGKGDYMSPAKRLVRKATSWITYLIPKKLANKAFTAVCTASNKKQCEYTTNFLSGFGWKKQMVKSDVYGEGQLLKYEGELFNAPADYDMLLTSLYRDYMSFPPIEKRNSGHIISELDLGIYEDVVCDKKSNDINLDHSSDALRT